MFYKLASAVLGAAVVVGLLGCSNSQATTISGSYSFTASGFADFFGSSPVPIAEISGSLGFTYSYSPDFPPIAGQNPLLVPTFLNLSFDKTTFTAADTRLDLEFGDYSSYGDAYTHLGVTVQSRADLTNRQLDNSFTLVFVLNPDGTQLVDPTHIQSTFGYGMDGHFFYTTTNVATTNVTVSCDPGYCAVNDPPLAPSFVSVPVPGPTIGSGVPGLIFVSGALVVGWRRRRPALI
jgi:hypothetical protein